MYSLVQVPIPMYGKIQNVHFFFIIILLGLKPVVPFNRGSTGIVSDYSYSKGVI